MNDILVIIKVIELIGWSTALLMLICLGIKLAYEQIRSSIYGWIYSRRPKEKGFEVIRIEGIEGDDFTITPNIVNGKFPADPK